MGSEARVKIMRLFLFNPDTPFDMDDIKERCRVTATVARKEINMLFQVYFLNERRFTKQLTLPPLKRDKTKTPRIKKKATSGWVLNNKFALLQPLKHLLAESNLADTKDLLARFRGMGPVKLFVVSGIFVDDLERTLDILIVGDKLDKKKIDRAIKVLESEMGKELRYSVFTREEFKYRLDMYDRLVRDVFEYDHDVLVNKLQKFSL